MTEFKSFKTAIHINNFSMQWLHKPEDVHVFISHDLLLIASGIKHRHRRVCTHNNTQMPRTIVISRKQHVPTAD